MEEDEKSPNKFGGLNTKVTTSSVGRMNIFDIVTRWVRIYTFRYAEKHIGFLYEVFCGVGDFVWGGGVLLAGAVRGFKAGYGLVLCVDDVWDRGGAANRGFQTHSSKAGNRLYRFGCAV